VTLHEARFPAMSRRSDGVSCRPAARNRSV